MHVNIRRLRALAAAVIAYLLLSASSCSVSQQYVGSGAPKLQFLGDSITVQSANDIDARFGNAFDVAIDAFVGADTYLQAATAAAETANSPAIEVINLGTNDAARMNKTWYLTSGDVLEPAQTLDDITGRLDAFAAEFPASTCVIFVTVNTHDPSWAPENATAINDHIRANFAHVADWDAAWSAEYFARPDDPHPNAAGRAALIDLEEQSLATCGPS